MDGVLKKYPAKFRKFRVHRTVFFIALVLFILLLVWYKKPSDNRDEQLPKDVQLPIDVPPACPDIGFDIKEGYVSLSLKYDPCCKICQIDNEKPHIITNFFHPVHNYWRSRSGQPYDIQLAVKRLDELMYVLNKKLSDERVAAVHLLFNHPFTLFFMQRYSKVENRHRLILHHVKDDPSHADSVAYVNEYLLNRIVVFMNQDVYFDDGINLLKKSILCDQNVTYALSRHGRNEKYCFMNNTDCSKDYFGSHDTYIFCLKAPVDMKHFELLKSKSDNKGIENLWIWIFRKLDFKVLNPCLVMKTYHVHCNQIHSKSRPRYNMEYSGTAIPTHKLM